MTELDGFEQDRTGWGGSGAYTSPVDLLTLHTTEGNGIEGARSTLNQHGSQPHVLVEARAAKGRRKIQMVDLDRAAKALRNQAGGIQTNKNGTLQIELVGFAAHPENLTEDDWLWFGREVVGPMCRAKGIPLQAPLGFHPYPPPGHQLGREPWRVVGDDGDTIQGIVGHQNWRENVHGDPGDLSAPLYRSGTTSAIDLILEGADAPTPTPPTPKPEGLLMALTDDEQAELLAKIRDLHEQWIGKQVDAKDESLRQLLKTIGTRTSDLVTGKRPGR